MIFVIEMIKMQSSIINKKAFLSLVKAGLWEKDVRLSQYKKLDYSEICRLSEEQSVIGLVAAGIDHVVDVKPPQPVVLQIVGESLQLEQRNRQMNCFVASVIEKMRKAGIFGLLIKGSGLAQCYERPFWRSCGDVDFFFSKSNYNKAVDFFLNEVSAKQVQNAKYTKSLGVILLPWFVELHGTLRNGLSTKMDKEIDSVQKDIFDYNNVRSWNNNGTTIFLPSPDNDLFLVFAHFVRHFYKEGVCLRQICDWCRLVWTYKQDFDVRLLESRLKRAGLISEWKAFASLAIDYLDMPIEAMLLYDDNRKWHKKGKQIMSYILDEKKKNKVGDVLAIAKIFPWSTIKYLPSIFFHLNWLKIKEKLFGE